MTQRYYLIRSDSDNPGDDVLVAASNIGTGHEFEDDLAACIDTMDDEDEIGLSSDIFPMMSRLGWHIERIWFEEVRR